MVPINVRLYMDEDFSQVVDIAVDPLGQARSEAEGVISWASLINTGRTSHHLSPRFMSAAPW